VKTIISYLLIFVIITLFTLFLDAVSGLFVLIIFISAIFTSTILHMYALRVFTCGLSVNAELVEKNEEILLTVRTGAARLPFLPTIFEITFKLSYHLSCAEEHKSCTLTLARQETVRTFPLKPEFWGKATISIESVKATDILGIYAAFSRKLELREGGAFLTRNTLHAKVFPSIPDLSKSSELIKTLEDASAYDDNEQSREIPFAITGFPGYEHRDYVPGDSLKSINWKLSAKRDKLLTRKPEAYAGGDQVLVLDSHKSTHNNNVEDDLTARTHEQVALESLLALAQVLTKQEILCRAYFRFDEEWGYTTLQNSGDIEKLRFALTEYAYCVSNDRLPDLTQERASGFVIFTANPDNELYSQADTLRQKGTIPEIASPVAGYANNWQIEEIDGETVFTRG
jgi:hypothetical protein